MQQKVLSLRPFIGSKNFDLSRSFYRDLGFAEKELGGYMSYFSMQGVGFYLQNAYVRDWIDNTMVFIEVEDVAKQWDHLQSLDLTTKYEGVKLAPVRHLDWGSECFVHDPAGVLWHFGEFRK